MDPDGDQTVTAGIPNAAAAGVPTAVAGAGPRVQFSEQLLPSGGEAGDPYHQENRLNKSDIEKVIEKRITGGSDHSDLMILYTARGRWKRIH